MQTSTCSNSTMKLSTLFLCFGILLAKNETSAFVAPRPVAVNHHPSLLSLVGPESLSDLIGGGSHLLLSDYPVSPDPIHTEFKIGTFFSQPFFLLMILFPKSTITKKIMGGLGRATEAGNCFYEIMPIDRSSLTSYGILFNSYQKFRCCTP